MARAKIFNLRLPSWPVQKRIMLCLLIVAIAWEAVTVETVVGNPANDFFESCFCVTWGTIFLWIGLLTLRREMAAISHSGGKELA